MQFLQFFFRQRQLFIAVHAHITLQNMTGNVLRFTERVHLIRTALVNVQLRDLVLILHFQHIRHRRFPRVGNTLLVRRANQAHVETGTAAHRRDIDNLNAVTVEVVAHKASKQMLKRMNPFFRHHFFVRNAKTQIKHGDCVAMRGVHRFCNPDRRRLHPGMIDCEAI
ncbi:Uncharacterised protein [Salmonella enterica subsp. enterica serovar Bovismorbificans]|uniref:Uncharacterized protein n=1 Tax=Salmonella enterica subsp. enterica serovar Bovismorbificans TaxID=58097 RepID=A0A655CST4_SALET|nr:Uncharacterised protein [Salmonella enterica subsp. enterica serovar Bovismorbificans]